MAGNDVGQRRTQRVGIEGPAQPQRKRQVVHRGWALQLVDEPQPVLGERQWHHGGPFRRRHPGPLGGGAARFANLTDALCQLGDGGRLEHRAHRQVGAECGVDLRDQAHGREGIPAEVEERVINTNRRRLEPEQLRIDGGQHLLDAPDGAR